VREGVAPLLAKLEAAEAENPKLRASLAKLGAVGCDEPGPIRRRRLGGLLNFYDPKRGVSHEIVFGTIGAHQNKPKARPKAVRWLDDHS
jgi:hypothetical protein